MNTTSSVKQILNNTITVTDSVNKTLTITDTDSVSKSKQVDLIADKLVLALNNPSRRNYYCKIGYKLKEHQIWNNLEQAVEKGRNTAKLFSFLCEKDMKTR